MISSPLFFCSVKHALLKFIIYQQTACICHLEVSKKTLNPKVEMVLGISTRGLHIPLAFHPDRVPLLKDIPALPYEMLTVSPAGSVLSQVK